jgi:hypothetical protein
MFVDVREYFRTILNSLGFREWKTAFSYDNIPSSILNESYHLTVEPIVGGPANHQCHEFDCPITLRVFLKGFRDESESVDAAMEVMQNILCAVLDSKVRLGSNIKDVVANSVQPIPLSSTNDNSVIIEFSMTAKIFIKFNI